MILSLNFQFWLILTLILLQKVFNSSSSFTNIFNDFNFLPPQHLRQLQLQLQLQLQDLYRYYVSILARIPRAPSSQSPKTCDHSCSAWRLIPRRPRAHKTLSKSAGQYRRLYGRKCQGTIGFRRSDLEKSQETSNANRKAVDDFVQGFLCEIFGLAT